MRIYISKRPSRIGGGSNSFSELFCSWAKKDGHQFVDDPRKASLAIVIAHTALENDIREASARGCRIIHRLDEHFEDNERGSRKEKHDRIIRLNSLAHVTIFQSKFVFDNVFPHIRPEKWDIIHNGGDNRKFRPASKPGKYIGHVSWGVDSKKRLDLLKEFILAHQHEKFLLVGRHEESGIDFRLPNVKLAGKVGRWRIQRYFRKMKMLYFPSENDPCPNTVVESILSGVPVCYNPVGGSIELVTGSNGLNSLCGLPLSCSTELLADLEKYRKSCFNRNDLYFDSVYRKYMSHAK